MNTQVKKSRKYSLAYVTYKSYLDSIYLGVLRFPKYVSRAP